MGNAVFMFAVALPWVTQDAVVSLIFDATKVMIPVITGFTVLFAGSVGKIWQLRHENKPLHIVWWLVGLVDRLVFSRLFCRSTGSGHQVYRWRQSAPPGDTV